MRDEGPASVEGTGMANTVTAATIAEYASVKVWAYVEIIRNGEWTGMARLRDVAAAYGQALEFENMGYTSRVTIKPRGRV